MAFSSLVELRIKHDLLALCNYYKKYKTVYPKGVGGVCESVFHRHATHS